jgi:putative DNA primase/helicase
MTTGIDYIELDDSNYEMMEVREEVLDLMRKLFPDPELNRYMWDHLASCLIGTSLNQTFNVYYGVGSNGKSILTDLMSRALGDYKGTVPITLITDKRSAIGGTSSEIIQLKGVRYAVMQEPSKDTKINEGIMKELTGGDPLQGRALYNESETFTPQFNLVVCTNSQFKIESNDDGTWRRIREVAFNSKFVDDESEIPIDQDANSVQQCFLKDKNLKEKLPKLAPIFMSMLVARAFETGGKVDDCPVVMEASRAYRLSQDKITTFVNQYLELTLNPTHTVPLTVIKNQFKIFSDNHSSTFPKAEFIAHFEKQAKYKGKIFFDQRYTKLSGVKIFIREHMPGVLDEDIENVLQNSVAENSEV